MHKAKLYKMYLDLWQFAGDLGRKRDCIQTAKKHTTYSLTKEERKKVVDFYKPYGKVNPVFHEFFAEKTGVFDERILPNDFHFTKIDTFYNNWHAAKVIDNKCYYENIFAPVKSMKHPEAILRRINGFWLDAAWKQITVDEVCQIVEHEKEFFLKIATHSEGGKGVFYFGSENKDTSAEFLNLANSIAHDLIVQKPIRQCEELSRLNSSSVNTVRIISLLKATEVVVYSAVVRIGTNGAKVDNASSGGLCCGIDEHGRLKAVAYTDKGQRFDEHPTSGVKFSDISIPGYDKAVALVKASHPILPEFRLISWDIAIDADEEPVLVEANLNYGGITTHQLSNGPLFGEDTEEILAEVFGKKK